MRLSSCITRPAIRHRHALRASPNALPSQPAASPICRHLGRRIVSRSASSGEAEAAIEQQVDPSAAVDPAAAAAEEQGEGIVNEQAGPVDPELAAEIDANELDDAQETLLKWMLFKTEQEQEDDLDEMIDYTEFGAEEYEELHEELDAAYDVFDYNLSVGDKVVGTVIDVDDEGAYVDVGAKGSAFLPIQEASFARLKTTWEVVRPGMKREFLVVGNEEEYGQLMLSLGAIECTTFWQRLKQIQEERVTVYATVESANRGGLLLKYGQYEGFMPTSMFGPLITMENAEEVVGYDIPVQIIELNEVEERLVFSNRMASTSIGEAQGFVVGQVVTGVVQSVKPYGAFVELGGVTGLLHVSQISHERIASVDKILKEGDKLKVMIMSLDKDRGRVTLSTKKLEPTPGDMLRDPQLVFEKAEEVAATFRDKAANANFGDAVLLDPTYNYQQGGPLPGAPLDMGPDGGNFIL